MFESCSRCSEGTSRTEYNCRSLNGISDQEMWIENMPGVHLTYSNAEEIQLLLMTQGRSENGPYPCSRCPFGTSRTTLYVPPYKNSPCSIGTSRTTIQFFSTLPSV